MIFETFLSVRNAVLRRAWRAWPLRRGRTRLQKWIWNRVRGSAVAYDEFGHRLLLDLEEYIDCCVYLDGNFEGETIGAFVREARELKAEIGLDIGAHIGLYTLALAELPSMEAVYAFEPDPVTFSRLQWNVEASERGNKIDVLPVAVAGRTGKEIFRPETAPQDQNWGKRNRGRGRVISRDSAHPECMETEAVSLDDRLNFQGRRIAIKIDVEGNELEVIRGARGLLTRNTCLIQVEIFPEYFESVDRELRSLGYSHLTDQAEAGHNYRYRNAT